MKTAISILTLGLTLGLSLNWSFYSVSAQTGDPMIMHVNQVRVEIPCNFNRYFSQSSSGYQNPAAKPNMISADQVLHIQPVLSSYDSVTTPYLLANTEGVTWKFFGPIDESTGLPFGPSDLHWKRVWNVYRYEIESLRADFEFDHKVDSVPYYNILIWPAEGNPHFEALMGFALPDQDLAPFLDRNQNDRYEPILGDIPLIDPDFPDIIPNQMTWHVVHDLTSRSQNNDYLVMDVELQYMTFSFNCETGSPLNQTIFHKTTIINRSSISYPNTISSTVGNVRIRCGADDYVGTDTSLRTAYTYNAAFPDGRESFCTVDSTSVDHLEYPTVIAGIQLGEPLDYSVCYEPYSSGPWQSLDFFLASNGYADLEGGYRKKYGVTYPDYPTDTSGWSMVTDSTESDRPIWIYGNNEGDFIPGDRLVKYEAIYSNHDSTKSSIEQPIVLKTAVPIIHSFFNNGFSNCDQISDTFCQSDCVWPGDVNADGRVYHNDLLLCAYTSSLNKTGPNRTTISYNWLPFYSEDWNATFNDSLDYKLADCDGNGTTNTTDVQAIVQNYANRTPEYEEIDPINSTAGDSGLQILFDTNRVVEGSSLYDNVILNFILNFSLFDVSDIALKGFSFKLKPDLEYFDVDYFNPYNEYIWFAGGDRFHMAYTDSIKNEQDIVMVNTDNVIMDHGRYLPSYSIYSLRSDLRVPEDKDSLYIPFPIYDLYGIDTAGNYVELNYVEDSIFLMKRFSGISETDNKETIRVYPNPASDELYIEAVEDISIKNANIVDMTGRVLRKWDLLTSPSIDISQLSSGVYILQLGFDDGSSVARRFVVQKE